MLGETIGHYRVISKLGEGGMGLVYRAEDQKLHREVALKFLPPELVNDPDARQRLLNEARAASRLSHPNIATIYEVSDTGETPFIAMELVTGESLKQILLSRGLSPEELLDVARQIGEGLNAAHQVGMIHRDIKPANIMLDAHGRAKVLDFGLAVIATGPAVAPGETSDSYRRAVVGPWSTGGTVFYMSPEQLRREAGDARSDIFSYGVLLYECLTGRLPFRGETNIDVEHAILRQPPTPLRTLVPDISLQWEQMIERCLAKAPDQRFQSMRDVLDALRRVAAPAPKVEKSLAVLYFENLSKSEEDEYFRDGITEDVITDLSKIKELRVFPRSAVVVYRDKPSTAPQIGQQLNAAYVLGGSLRRAGNRLRITAQLVETRTGHTVWAERYDRQMEDVFAIQDEIAKNITTALQVMLTPKEKRAIEKAPTVDVKAYDYYLRGRKFFHQFRRKGFEFARQMFERAIEIDPRYARAYAGIADCCAFLYRFWDSSDDTLQQAEAASRKALQLDPELAEAHASLGLALSLRKQYDEAQKEFETAMKLDPKLFEAYYFFARTLYGQGKLEEAIQWFEEAGRVNPDDFQAPVLCASAYEGLGRHPEAQAAYRRALEAVEKHLQLNPDDARAVYFGASAYCQLGQRERGMEWAQRALEMEPGEPQVLYNVACIYALVGESERAIDCLEKSITHGWGQKEWMEHDPDLATIRDHPRFQALLGKA